MVLNTPRQGVALRVEKQKNFPIKAQK